MINQVMHQTFHQNYALKKIVHEEQKCSSLEAQRSIIEQWRCFMPLIPKHKQISSHSLLEHF